MSIGPILRAMRHNKTRFILIILEVAITLAIVTNCVNMILHEREDMKTPSGFVDEQLLWLRTRPFAAEYRDDRFFDDITDSDLRTIASIPGVQAVANTNFRPWQGGGNSTTVKAAGVKGDVHRTQNYYGTEGVFDTLGAKISEGRGFVPGDYEVSGDAGPNKVVISRALARLLFPDGSSPIGKALQQSDASQTEVSAPFTIVGVVERFYNPYGWPIHEYAMFMPSRVGSYGYGQRFLIRVEPGAMKSVIPEIEKRMLASNSSRTFEFRPISDIKDEYFGGARLVVSGMTAVIVVLVFVTALGILGITSLSVAERTRQIGTRRALGATRGDILGHFLAENWIVTTAGLIVGVAATYGLNFLLVSHVSDVKMNWSLVAVGMVLLWLNGLLATVPPALRASMVSPAIATKSV